MVTTGICVLKFCSLLTTLIVKATSPVLAPQCALGWVNGLPFAQQQQHSGSRARLGAGPATRSLQAPHWSRQETVEAFIYEKPAPRE